jgi:hypothetical protein
MEELYNVEDLKKIVKVTAYVGDIIGGALEDKKITKEDLKEAEHIIPIFNELVSIKYSLVLPEIKDISPIEGQELVACFCEHFDIPQDNIENPVEFVLKFIGTSISYVIDFIKMIKPKAPVV